MDKKTAALVALSKDVFQKIVEKGVVTRAELNSLFRATNDLKRAEELSAVIRSFLRFGRVAKKMDLRTNSVTFWVPDKAHEDLEADAVDPDKYTEEDFLAIAMYGSSSVRARKADEQPSTIKQEATPIDGVKRVEEVRVELEQAIAELPPKRVIHLTKGGWRKRTMPLTDNAVAIMSLFEGAEGKFFAKATIDLLLTEIAGKSVPPHVTQRLLNSLEAKKLLQRGMEVGGRIVYWKFGEEGHIQEGLVTALEPDAKPENPRRVSVAKEPVKEVKIEPETQFVIDNKLRVDTISKTGSIGVIASGHLKSEDFQKYSISASKAKPHASIDDSGCLSLQLESGDSLTLSANESTVLLRLARRLDLIQLEVEDNAIRRY